jgi:hypothetical protein
MFRSGNVWLAQGLELDICAQGPTRDIVCARFRKTLRAEIFIRFREAAEPIKPAPHRFFAEYEKAPKYCQQVVTYDVAVSMATLEMPS